MVEVCGNTVAIGKMVEEADNIGDHVLEEDPGEEPTREDVCTSTEALLDGADGAIDLADVPVACTDTAGGGR
jgi:hypothetical protein